MDYIRSAGAFGGRLLGISSHKVVNLSVNETRNPSVDSDSLMIVGSGRTVLEGTCVAAGTGLTLTLVGVATGGLGVPIAAGVLLWRQTLYGLRRG